MKSLFPVFLILCTFSLSAQKPVKLVPLLDGESWQVCTMPDLKELNGPNPQKQHIVDHGFIQATDGTWQLWACLRGTAVERFLYRWEADSLTQRNWRDKGIALRADTTFGEQPAPKELLQAPYFMKIGPTYYCFYNSREIRVLSSSDGKNYTRLTDGRGSNCLYHANGPCTGRDVMIMKDDSMYYMYSTVSISNNNFGQGFVIMRTSPDLKNWSDFTIVSEGGIAGNGPVSSESPFVLKYQGYYYLFRASSITFKTYVYRSDNPYHFGVNDDAKLVAVLPLKAPEVLEWKGHWYISDLAGFQGLRMYKLKWVKENLQAKIDRN